MRPAPIPQQRYMMKAQTLTREHVSRRNFLRGAAVVAAAGVVSTTPVLQALAKKRTTGVRVTTPGRCLIGAHVSPKPGQAPEDAIAELEGELGMRLAVDRQYYHDEIFPTAYDYWTASQGRTPAHPLGRRRRRGMGRPPEPGRR
jgi:hypothetical protein